MLLKAKRGKFLGVLIIDVAKARVGMLSIPCRGAEIVSGRRVVVVVLTALTVGLDAGLGRGSLGRRTGEGVRVATV